MNREQRVFGRIERFLSDREGSGLRDLALLAMVFGVAFFQRLGDLPLIEPDEGRYAEIPREMLALGDFVTPRLNYVKYFEKPPLHYWLNALSFTVFGQNEFAARFVGTLCGLLTVLLTYWVGRKLFSRREGLLAALVLGTSAGFLVQARINLTDMTLTLCLTACLSFFILAAEDPGPRKGTYYQLFYVFSALAVLAKGLVGLVLPGAITVSHLILRRRTGAIREMRLPTGVPLYLLVAAPWFVLVSLRNPEFPHFFFVREHFQRYLTEIHGRYQPPWFFVPVLFGVLLPWSFFLPAALRRWWAETRSGGASPTAFLVLWAGIIFVFFSLSSSKLVPYILPVLPALALLLGRFLSAALADPGPLWKRTAWSLGGFLTVLGLAVLAYPMAAPRPVAITIGGGLVLGGLLAAQGLFGLYSARRGRALGLVASLCLLCYLFGVFGPPFVYAYVVARESSKTLALQVRARAGPDEIVAALGYEQALPFYTGRRVVVVGARGELEFGSQQGDQSAWFLDQNRLTKLWEGPRTVFVLAKAKHLDDFERSVRTPVRVLGREGTRILITNH